MAQARRPRGPGAGRGASEQGVSLRCEDQAVQGDAGEGSGTPRVDAKPLSRTSQRASARECCVFETAQEEGVRPLAWCRAVGRAGSLVRSRSAGPVAAALPVGRGACRQGCRARVLVPSAGPLGGTPDGGAGPDGGRGVRWESCPWLHRHFAAFRGHSRTSRSGRGPERRNLTLPGTTASGTCPSRGKETALACTGRSFSRQAAAGRPRDSGPLPWLL